MKKQYFNFIEKNPELFINPTQNIIKIITDVKRIMQIQNESGLEIGIVYEDDYILVLRDAVEFPDSSVGTYIRIIPQNRNCAVAVFPIVGGKILLIKHFRHSTRKEYLEIPRGWGEEGKIAEEMAGKELFEETGLMVKKMSFLGTCAPDTGLIASEVSIYLAELEKGNAKSIDKQEAISGYITVSIEEMKTKIKEGQIIDGFTLSAYAFYMASM